jgi:predicted nucleic acid-binding protein
MRPVVLDTPVVLGFCDPDDPSHNSSRLAISGCLTSGYPLVVPVSVLSEVLVGAFRSTQHAVRTVEGFLDEQVTEVRPLDRAAGRAAARFRAEHPTLGFAAALVLGTAKSIEAEQILTTEIEWAGYDDRVRVVAA